MINGLGLAISWLTASAMLFTGCTGEPEESPEPTITETQNTILEVSVSSLSIHCPPAVPPDVQYKTARMNFIFWIHNLNDHDAITLAEFEYVVYAEGYNLNKEDTLVRGEENIVFEPDGEGEITFHIPYIFKDNDSELWSDMIEGEVNWQIEGTAYLRTATENLSIPFQCSVSDYSISMTEQCLEGE